MTAVHAQVPDAAFDGGDLDCGNGLLLLIRQHIDPLRRGQLLEIISTEGSVREDLPAWCRLTKNELVSVASAGAATSFLVCKGTLAERVVAPASNPPVSVAPRRTAVSVTIPECLPKSAPAPVIAPLSVMGIGSWPRPRWFAGPA